MMQLKDLPGLGPKSQHWLQAVGIMTPDDLRATGAVQAFVKIRSQIEQPVSLNLLYAIAGAIDGQHWTGIAKAEKSRLLTELDGYQELVDMLQTEAIKITL